MTTSIQKDALLAQFAVLAYKDSAFLGSAVNLPAGWELTAANDQSPPFAAFAFKNAATGEVVIAFRGTDGLKDAAADAAILRGTWDTQFKQGMDFVASVQGNPRIFDPDHPPELLVTGHSLGGAIAQVVAKAFGLDGATIDPGAAARIVQTPEFAAAAIAAGLPATGLGAPSSFTNYLVAGSVVSANTGTHIGQTSYLPSLTFSGEQALTTFLVGMLHPVAGVAYAIATDQFANKHSSAQVSEALGLLAGSQQAVATPGALTLSPKEVGFKEDPQTGLIKPTYSQTEFDVKSADGVMQGTIKFSGSGSDRTVEWFDVGGALKSITTLSPTGAVTVQPINQPSITVDQLPSLDPTQDGLFVTVVKDVDDQILSSTTTQTDDSGNTLIVTTHADGSGTARALDPSGHLIKDVPFQRDGGVDGAIGTATETINGKSVVLDIDFTAGKVTGIESVNGAPAQSAAQIDAALQAAGITTSDLILSRRLGELNQLSTAADPGDADGLNPVIAAPGQPWYGDSGSQTFAASLSSVQSLIAGLQSHKSLPTATGLFCLGATFTGSGELAQVGCVLSIVNALVNLRDAFERGDVTGGLYNSAVLGQGVLRLYTCDGLTGCANDLDWRNYA